MQSYPKEHDPIWIDWKGAAEGGLRVIAATDEDGKPLLAAVEIDQKGEMLHQPKYEQGRAWYTTRLFIMPDGNTQIWRFTATVSPDCLLMGAKPVPSETYEARAVSWTAQIPAASF